MFLTVGNYISLSRLFASYIKFISQLYMYAHFSSSNCLFFVNKTDSIQNTNDSKYMIIFQDK